MKRGANLIRKILLECEAWETPSVLHDPVIEGYSREQIGFHVHLLEQANYLQVIRSSFFEPFATPVCLTNAGYDFLESIRDQSIWDKTMAAVKSTKTWTIATLSIIAAEFAKESAMELIK